MNLNPFEIQAIIVSLKASAISMFFQTPLALLLGYQLARNQFRGKVLVESFLNLPQVMPPVITGFLLLVLFGREGFIGAKLYAVFGIQIAFSFTAVVLASSLVSFPIYVGFVKSAVEMIDSGLESAARTLGKGNFYVFFTITFPLALPGILNGFVLAFARNIGEFGATITFAGNIQGSTQTIPLAVYNAMQIPGGELQTFRLVAIAIFISVSVMLLSATLKRKMIFHG